MSSIVQNNTYLQAYPISLEAFKKYLSEKIDPSPGHVEKIHILCTQLFNMIKLHVDSHHSSEKEFSELSFSHPENVQIKVSTKVIKKIIDDIDKHPLLVHAIKESRDSKFIFEIMHGLWIAAVKEFFSTTKKMANELNITYKKTYNILKRNDEQFLGAFDPTFLSDIKKLYEKKIPKNLDVNSSESNFSSSIDPSSSNTIYDAEVIPFNENFQLPSKCGHVLVASNRIKEIYLFQTRLFNLVKTHIASEKILPKEEYENSLLKFSHPDYPKKTIEYSIIIRLIETIKKFDSLKSKILNFKELPPIHLILIMHGLWIAIVRKCINIDGSIKSPIKAASEELGFAPNAISRKNTLCKQFEKLFNYEVSECLSSFNLVFLKDIKLLDPSSKTDGLIFFRFMNPSFPENELKKSIPENSNESSSSSSSSSSSEVKNLPSKYDEEIIPFDETFKLPSLSGLEKAQPGHLKQIYLLQTRLFNIVKKHLDSKIPLEEYENSPFTFSHPEYSKKTITSQTIIHLIESVKKFEPLKSLILNQYQKNLRKPQKDLKITQKKIEDNIRCVMLGLWGAAIRIEVKKDDGIKHKIKVITDELDIHNDIVSFNLTSQKLQKTFSPEDSAFLGSFNLRFLKTIKVLDSQSDKNELISKKNDHSISVMQGTSDAEHPTWEAFHAVYFKNKRKGVEPTEILNIFRCQQELYQRVRNSLGSSIHSSQRVPNAISSLPLHSSTIIKIEPKVIDDIVEQIKANKTICSAISMNDAIEDCQTILQGMWEYAVVASCPTIISIQNELEASNRYVHKLLKNWTPNFIGMLDKEYKNKNKIVEPDSSYETMIRRLANNEICLDEALQATGFPKLCIKAKLKKMTKDSKSETTSITQEENSEDEKHIEKKQKTIALSTPSENQSPSNVYEFPFPLLTDPRMDLTSSSSFSFPMLSPPSVQLPMTGEIGTYFSTNNHSTSSNSMVDDIVSTDEMIKNFPFF